MSVMGREKVVWAGGDSGREREVAGGDEDGEDEEESGGEVVKEEEERISDEASADRSSFIGWAEGRVSGEGSLGAAE